jgi:hypothetical protein
MDFFTVPTIARKILYCFFVIGHDRRRILHLNVTPHPTSAWIVQQSREAFPYQSAPQSEETESATQVTKVTDPGRRVSSMTVIV